VDIEAAAHQLGRDCARFRLRRDRTGPRAFLAGYDSFRGPKLRADYFTKKWLGLRLNAVRRGLLLDERVSPAVLEAMMGDRCPVSFRRFDLVRKGSPDNPSVDRIINEGTYALGNLMVISQRVNRAKGNLSFEAVAGLAQNRHASDGLDAPEWMRLASLMYGAWNAQRGDSDPYLVPMATYPMRHMCTPLSQVIQLLLLRAIVGQRPILDQDLLRELTMSATGSARLFEDLVASVEDAACDEPHLPNVWLRPRAFDAFEAWYVACRREVDAVLSAWRATQYPYGFDLSALLEGWRLGGRQQRLGTATLAKP